MLYCMKIHVHANYSYCTKSATVMESTCKLSLYTDVFNIYMYMSVDVNVKVGHVV